MENYMKKGLPKETNLRVATNRHHLQVLYIDMKKGLPEEIKIKVVSSWSHLQFLGYEQIKFKCNLCHVYRHFERKCPRSNKLHPILKHSQPQNK